MNLKKTTALVALLSLVSAPKTTYAKIETSHLAIASATLATATALGLWKVYVDECREAKKEASFAEFTKFIKGFVTKSEVRSAVTKEHPLLTAAIIATLAGVTATTIKAGSDYLNKKESKPEINQEEADRKAKEDADQKTKEDAARKAKEKEDLETQEKEEAIQRALVEKELMEQYAAEFAKLTEQEKTAREALVKPATAPQQTTVVTQDAQATNLQARAGETFTKERRLKVLKAIKNYLLQNNADNNPQPTTIVTQDAQPTAGNPQAAGSQQQDAPIQQTPAPATDVTQDQLSAGANQVPRPAENPQTAVITREDVKKVLDPVRTKGYKKNAELNKLSTQELDMLVGKKSNESFAVALKRSIDAYTESFEQNNLPKENFEQ